MKGSASWEFVPSAADAPNAGSPSAGALRTAKPLTIWGGRGCGASCNYCGAVLSEMDVEYEVDAQIGAERVTLHFHRRCYDTWKAERGGD